MNDKLKSDFVMTDRYLDLLVGSTDEVITFQFFNDRDKKSRNASVRHMKRKQAYAVILKKQSVGCGVFVMVNAGDGKGRTKKNVVKVRAIFIDLDGSPREPAVKALRPHIVVETSPGRWHLYWLVSDCPLEEFKAIQQAIALKFNGDKSCCDLPRVLRLPGFFRLKDKPVMTALVEANDFPPYTTQQIIHMMGLVLAAPGQRSLAQPPRPQKAESPDSSGLPSAYTFINPTTGETTDLVVWAAQNRAFDIVKATKPQFAVGKIADGKQHIICPFAGEHTDTSPDFSTFIANATADHSSFTICCMHSHCAGRDRLEFLLAMFKDGWLPNDILTSAKLPPKRVHKVYYPAGEIASNLQLRVLAPDEFRIFLHLMHLSWAAEDGTLPDDDWMLARSLGLEESRWQGYREVLVRTGWMYVDEGRLVNVIFKREFSNAQKAFDSYRARGQKGGKSHGDSRTV